jgi:multicomponent K+:H+ antiporter subunit G
MMGHAADLPAWAAIVVSLLVVLGAALAFIGSLGLLRLKDFYQRVHPPTMGTTLGTGLVLIGSMVFFSVLESRPVLHEILIGIFMTVSTPVTFMLLMRAALHRDRVEGKDPAREPAEREPGSPPPPSSPPSR